MDLKTMKVVMLPSEKATSFAYSEVDHNHVMLPYPEAELCDMQQLEASTYGYQQLCLISSDPYKNGDWIYYIDFDPNRDRKAMLQKTSNSMLHGVKIMDNPHLWRKIVAVTDKHLSLDTSEDGLRYDAVPLISEDFVKAFVKSNGSIKEVQVEMMKNPVIHSMVKLEINSNYGSLSHKKTKDQMEYLCELDKKYLIPKTREDGTVFIHRAKDRLTSVQETVTMFEILVDNYDNLSSEEMKAMLISYLDILKEDSGLNDLRDKIEISSIK